MPDGYLLNRSFFEDISDSAVIGSGTTSVTPIAPRALDSIMIQRVVVDVVSPGVAGTKWTITDTNGTVLTADFPADVAGSFPRDFLAEGRALKEGEGLVINADAGASGIVSWEGFRKRTGVGAA